MLTRARVLFALVIALLFGATKSHAQGSPATLRVFLDCQSFYCDSEFMRTELTWVDWVRDRAVADVHILGTSERTGSGGTAYTLTLIGQQTYVNRTDTLRFNLPPTTTDDERRRALLRVISLGLIRYVIGTPAAEKLSVSYQAPAATEKKATVTTKDPWNYWVFRARTNGDFNGEKLFKAMSTNGSVSADRVTAAWKINTSFRGNYRESKYVFSDGTKYNSYTRGYGTDGLIVKSLTDHWSAGMSWGANRSDYVNQRLAITVAPAIEYNIFPYAEATRRQLTLRYRVGATKFDYLDTTIYELTGETRTSESVTLAADAKQKWGSINGSLSARHYFFDINKNSMNANLGMDLRLFKGFSFNMFGYVERVHDQLYLAKGDASDADVLTRRRQLATSYNYFTFLGFGYTFGSVLNNIVNPRFNDGGGFFFSF